MAKKDEADDKDGNPFSEGCPLWVLADASTSRWSRRIDWYLNFQIMKAESHVPAELPPEVRAIDDEWPTEIPELDFKKNAPLMVASRTLLPNAKTVVIDYNGRVADWAGRCHVIWRELNEPPMRVFLPDRLKAEDFLSAWKKEAGKSGTPPQIVSESGGD